MKKQVVIPVLVLGIIVMAFGNAFAQKQIETQGLLWTRYYLKMQLSAECAIRHEIEERQYWLPWRQHQFVSRTHVEKKLGKGWRTALGFTYFVQSLPHDPQSAISFNRIELRPQLELAYKSNISEVVSLQHRYWTEFRFYELTNGSYKYNNNRTRYKLQLSVVLPANLSLHVFDEIHLNIGEKIVRNVFNQNRYGFSIQYMPYEHLGCEIGYLNWFQEQSSGTDFFNRHILRVTIHHKLNFTKS